MQTSTCSGASSGMFGILLCRCRVVIRTDIVLPWSFRLALLFGGRLSVTWYHGATGPKIANVDVKVGKPKEAVA